MTPKMHGTNTKRKSLVQKITSLLLIPSVVMAQYEMTPVQGLVDFAGSTTLYLGDDNTRNLQLGFPFTFDENIYSNVWVSSNGFLSFSTGDNLCCAGSPIANARTPIGIFGAWTDLISGPNPYVKSTQDMFLVTWDHTFEYATNLQLTFQIQLNADDSFSIRYGVIPDLYYHIATAGYKGAVSSEQLAYGSNLSVLSNTGYLYSFPEIEEVFLPVTIFSPTEVGNESNTTVQENTETNSETASYSDITAEQPAAEQSRIEQTGTSETTGTSVATGTSGTSDTPGTSGQSTTDTTKAKKEEISPFAFGYKVNAGNVFKFDTVDQESSVDIAESESTVSVSSSQEISSVSLNEYLSISQEQSIDTIVQSTQSISSSVIDKQDIEDSNIEILQAEGLLKSEPIYIAQNTNLFSMDQQILLMQMDVPVTEKEPEKSETDAGTEIGTVDMSSYNKAKMPDQPKFYKSETPYRKRLQDNNLLMYRMTNDPRWIELRDSQYER